MKPHDQAEVAYKNGYEKGVRDFAKRLEERKYQSSDWSHGEHPFVVEENDIEEVLEEMVGADVPDNNVGDKLSPTDKDINVPSKWISVKDRLPDCADTVIAVDRDGIMSTAYYVGYWHGGGDLDENAVTHWMLLPEPPKGE